MAESFVKTFKRDYVYVNRLESGASVLGALSEWFLDYNENHPHKGLGMLSPREFRKKRESFQELFLIKKTVEASKEKTQRIEAEAN